jgi:hypothetical protein
MNKNPVRSLLPAALAVALLVSAAPAMAQKAADDDTWYSAMTAGDACVPLAAVQQRIQTMLGFMAGPPWRTPSDVIYVMGFADPSIRPVLITPNVKVFARGDGGTMTFVHGYEHCLAHARSHGWTR